MFNVCFVQIIQASFLLVYAILIINPKMERKFLQWQKGKDINLFQTGVIKEKKII